MKNSTNLTCLLHGFVVIPKRGLVLFVLNVEPNPLLYEAPNLSFWRHIGLAIGRALHRSVRPPAPAPVVAAKQFPLAPYGRHTKILLAGETATLAQPA